MVGALIGGVGGRIAMFVLRLTSDDRLRGQLTDDQFEIGLISFATGFLVLFCSVLGSGGAVAYAVLRRWVPPRGRVPASAVFFGALGGSFILRPGEFDFTLLDPLALAVVMFIAIPAIGGAALSPAVDRVLDGDERPWRWWQLLALVPLVAIGPFVLLASIVAALVWLLADRVPAVVDGWRTPAVTWAGRAVLVVATVLLLRITIDDALAIL